MAIISFKLVCCALDVRYIFFLDNMLFLNCLGLKSIENGHYSLQTLLLCPG